MFLDFINANRLKHQSSHFAWLVNLIFFKCAVCMFFIVCSKLCSRPLNFDKCCCCVKHYHFVDSHNKSNLYNKNNTIILKLTNSYQNSSISKLKTASLISTLLLLYFTHQQILAASIGKIS